jgi:hypothetical protein
VLIPAQLGGLRCIDPVQSDTLALNFNSVAVNDISSAEKGGLYAKGFYCAKAAKSDDDHQVNRPHPLSL